MKPIWVRIVALMLLVGVTVGGLIYFRPVWVGLQLVHAKLWLDGYKSRDVQLGVGRIHYYEASPARGGEQVSVTPLLLVHGLGARSEEWADVMPALAKDGFHVYAIDLLGFGQSAQPDVNYSIPLQEEVVKEFIDSQHLEKVDIAGWSMGGWIVMQYTLDHPERVRRLIDFDSAGLLYMPAFRLDLFELNTPKQLDELWSFLSPKPAHFPDYVARDIIRENHKIAWVIHRSMANMTSGQYLLDGKAGAIKQPTLIVWGDKDRIIPVSLGEELHKDIPQSVLEIETGVGHRTPEDGAARSIKATVDFLRAEPPMPAQELILNAK